ncbi:hypothetical protein [Streptomyces sp. NPDC057695]|uniref:hypothetical protein n=1 Tax=Streptomyces sp. NPDC057695 TaxID=3346217 RepID=UPI00369A9B31
MEGTTGHSGGYRPSAGTAMPPLLPDRAEATAVALGTVVGRLTGMEETRWEPVAGKRSSGNQDAVGDDVVASAQPSSPAPAQQDGAVAADATVVAVPVQPAGPTPAAQQTSIGADVPAAIARGTAQGTAQGVAKTLMVEADAAVPGLDALSCDGLMPARSGRLSSDQPRAPLRDLIRILTVPRPAATTLATR